MVEIVNPVRRNLPQFGQGKIMVENFARVFVFTILRAVVFEVPDVLFLLRINRNNRIPCLNELLGFVIDKLKLDVSVWMGFAYASASLARNSRRCFSFNSDIIVAIRLSIGRASFYLQVSNLAYNNRRET
jgi:hypothetical protein